MPDEWTRVEVEATVASYLSMLAAELRGEPYRKVEHVRNLLPLLNGRTKGAVEFKHGNISAVLIEMGLPYISGYKPYRNYQALLREVVAEQLETDRSLLRAVAEDAERPVEVPDVEDILRTLTDPPAGTGRPRHGGERAPDQYGSSRWQPPVNYLEREARNQALGTAGELFVLRFEQARLAAAGNERLASSVEHVATTRGSGPGFDILSFEAYGAERLIEVKTTKYGKETPFYLSRHEVDVSREQDARYHLYRVFAFRRDPKLFALRGSLTRTCDLDPSQYVGRVA